MANEGQSIRDTIQEELSKPTEAMPSARKEVINPISHRAEVSGLAGGQIRHSGSSLGELAMPKQAPANLAIIDDAFYLKLLKSFLDVSHYAPSILLQFGEAIEYRSGTRGFPEYHQENDPIASVMKGVLSRVPSRAAILTAESAMAESDGMRKLPDVDPIISALSARMALGIVAAWHSDRGITQTFLETIAYLRQDPVSCACALLVDYAESKDQVPY